MTPLEEDIIDSRHFQRLRRIRQSPGVSMAFPGSSHTRFEHSLGAMHLAGEAATHLILNSLNDPPTDSKPVIEYFKTPQDRHRIIQQVQIARLGALLHDIGHAPFSHTFETFLSLCEVEWEHEHLSLEIIYKHLKPKFDDTQKNQYKINVLHVMSLLCDIDRQKDKPLAMQQNTKDFLSAIGLKKKDIESMEYFLRQNWFLNYIIKDEPYNADRFNYLVLDSNRSGATEYGAIDFHRLIQNLHIHEDTILVATKAKDAAIRFLEAYSHMYRAVYQHKISYGADLHLAYAMYLASELKKSNIFKDLRKNHTMEKILPLYDDVLIYELAKIDNPKCKEFIDDFLERRIISLAYETKEDTMKFRKLLEGPGKQGIVKKIQDDAKLKNAIVIIESIDEKKASKPPLSEDALKRISFLNLKTRKIEPIDEDVAKTLASKKGDLYYRVYTVKDSETKSKVEKAVKKLLS